MKNVLVAVLFLISSVGLANELSIEDCSLLINGKPAALSGEIVDSVMYLESANLPNYGILYSYAAITPEISIFKDVNGGDGGRILETFYGVSSISTLLPGKIKIDFSCQAPISRASSAE